jgi:hypothetical protein
MKHDVSVCRVAQAYVNQKKLDTETRILHTNAAQFSKQTLQWLKLVEDFNTALKVNFCVHIYIYILSLLGVRTRNQALQFFI